MGPWMGVRERASPFRRFGKRMKRVLYLDAWVGEGGRSCLAMGGGCVGIDVSASVGGWLCFWVVVVKVVVIGMAVVSHPL